jgi:hypothetical protein
MTGSFCLLVQVKGDAAMHPNCDAVNAILQAVGLPGRVRMLDQAVTTAQAAAQHLGCPVGAIANSLIFETFTAASLGVRVRVKKLTPEHHY